MKKLQLAYATSAAILFVPLAFGSSGTRELAWHLVSPLALAGVLAGVRIHRPAHRTPWHLLAAALVLLTAAVFLVDLQPTDGSSLGWSLAPVYAAALGWYALLIAAFWSFARRMSLSRDRGALLDIALMVVGGSVVVYELVLQPVFETFQAVPVTRAALLLYPLLNYCLLVVLARILMNPGSRPRALVVLLAARAVGALADLIVIAYQAHDPTSDPAFDWVASFASVVLMGAAALMPSMRDIGARAYDSTAKLGRVRLVAIGTALSLPALTSVVSTDSALDASTLVLPTAVMVVLVLTRVRLLFGSLSMASHEIERRQEYFRSLVNNITDVVLVTDADGRILDRTDSATGVFGLGRSGPLDHSDLEDIPHLVALMKEAASAPRMPVHGSARLFASDGRLRHFEIVLRDLQGVDAVNGLVWVLHDVSAQKELEDRLRHQALHDSLTGLPNRVLFADRLLLARARRNTETVAVLFVDLDDFKNVNDTLGHDAGDRLLREVAGRLLGAVREGDTVARLGGDEFGVLVEGEASSDVVATVAGRIVQALREPFTPAGGRLRVTASVGAATVDRDQDVDVLALADVAMYRAKLDGKDAWALFEDQSAGGVLSS